MSIFRGHTCQNQIEYKRELTKDLDIEKELRERCGTLQIYSIADLNSTAITIKDLNQKYDPENESHA